MASAILIERKALDVFHDEIGQATFGRAAVEQTRDMRMIEARQNLPFLAKTLQDGIGIHPALDELERDLLLELGVGPFGQEDRAHPPAPDFADEPIIADAQRMIGDLRLGQNAGEFLRGILRLRFQPFAQ